ncbi:MAG: glucose-1-phosphate cytidylyltransferase [Negativicutes bacterium]|nr:glucose-1-phosphate cytidylyltransferase [Negativicutes bacterium]
MKVVILAGGYGTRLSEETQLKPKPMVEIGQYPMLWHIMKVYSYYGFNEFIICVGYKGYLIKEYFANYFLHHSDVTFDIAENNMLIHNHTCEPWKVTIIDTGLHSMTGGRIRRVRDYIGNEAFCLTYGDGISNVNIPELISFHKEQKATVTLTAVQPPGRFGVLSLSDNLVSGFVEKPQGDGGWINGGFFVVEPEAFELISEDETVWEREPLENLAQNGRLAAYKHNGFWLPMDTLRDKVRLEELWNSGKAPWRLWE